MKNCNIKFIIMCHGCQDEIREAYEWQERGFNIAFDFIGGHMALIVFNDNGEIILQ